jgi:hypothetical protein
VPRYPGRKDTTSSNPRDAELVAKTVNSAWAVTADRIERGGRDWSSLYTRADNPDEALDARLERIEAAIFALAIDRGEAA